MVQELVGGRQRTLYLRKNANFFLNTPNNHLEYLSLKSQAR